MIPIPDQSGSDPLRRESLLRRIGVTEQELTMALDAGDAAAAGCTSNHPPMAPGFYRFAETIAALAAVKGPQGWTRQDHKNFSTIVSPDGRVAIAVASGNDGTGDLGVEVSTRSPKGVVTSEAVTRNLSLPYDDRDIAANQRILSASPVVITVETWFLLHDRRDGTRFAELSRPNSINSVGYVDEWKPRIPLGPQQMIPFPGSDGAGGDPPVNPDVPVTRRG